MRIDVPVGRLRAETKYMLLVFGSITGVLKMPMPVDQEIF